MPTSYDALVIADGAQAYWKLDEPSGSATLLDSTANGLNLTVVNGASMDAWQVPGIPAQPANSAIDSSGGAGGFYATSASATFQFTVGQSFSLEVWFGSVGVPTNATAFIGRGYATAAQDSRPWYMLGQNLDGTAFAWLRNVASVDYKLNSLAALSDSSYLTRGPWHHLVMVFDHVLATLSLYVDGVLQHSMAAPDTGWGTNGGPFAIQRHNGLSGGQWGTCYGVYIRALSAATVASHYDAGRAGVSWYPYQQSTSYGSLESALSTVQTALNRIVPPIISSLHISSTHHLTGTGTLALTGRGVIVAFDFVPAGWGYLLGLVNIFENRLVQLEFANLLGDGVTEVPSLLYDQYENIRLHLFSDNVPLSLNYTVAPGAGIVVQQITN